MTIKNSYKVICDKCETERLFEDVEGWSTFMTELRSEGWRSRKLKDDSWAHYCPDCHY
jgi:hypothetical protein